MSRSTTSPRPFGFERVRLEGLRPRLTSHFIAAGGAIAVLGLVGAYMARAQMTPVEGVLLCLGAGLLWGPFALGIDLVIRNEVPDRAARVALAFAGSYALTSLLFFLWSMAGFPAGLYLSQVIVVAGAAAFLWRRHRTSWSTVGRFALRPNWLFLGLVALALFTTAPYTKVAEETTSGSRNLRIPTDSLYYASQAYELSRDLPPTQDPTRAGTPPRSYHLLPHVTTVLLARATRQPDLLRAQILSHLTILTVGISTVLYALGKALAGRRLGGYALVALLYPLAVVTSPLLTSTTLEGRSFVQFFFTLAPQLSSLLEPAIFGSWQTYSAILPALGLLLAVATIAPRVHERLPSTGLFVLAGLLVTTLSRFRVQVFLVAVPAFLLVAALAWLRTKRRAVLVAGLVPLLAAVPLVLEATASGYRPGTSGLALGFNGLTVPGNVVGRVNASAIVGAWPFSRAVYDGLGAVLAGSAFQWAWQAVCLTAFVLLNMIGLLGLAALALYLTRRAAWSRHRLFSSLVVVMAVGSVVIGVLVKSDFDSYSLAGQALFLPAWYVFPVVAVAAGLAASSLQHRLQLPRAAWLSAGVLLVAGGAWMRETGPASRLTSFEYTQHIGGGDEMSQDRWRTLEWLRQETPARSVVISNEYLDYRLVFSGIAGRAAYLEGLGDINDTEAQRIYGDDRLAVVRELWATTDTSRFCAVLRGTPSTHLVQFADQPLAVAAPACLAPTWSSPEKEATVWTIT